MNYETVIGLEVHAELATASKIFCGCPTTFGGEPNTHCCPICTGMPGVLPVLNKKAVEYTATAGLAINCDISSFSKMDRKNYFYPDLVKAYQTSQYDLPICVGGYIDIEVDGKTKRIRLNRIHLEEDAGKLIHDGATGETLVDYNRCGVPLIEIVTEPDMRSPEEAIAFLEKLKSILEYTEVSDCKMQEGSLRCDVNLSLRPEGQEEYGTRTEMKNLNSFKSAFRAMEYEKKRQKRLLDNGDKVTQETRRWDDDTAKSFSMRSKEEAHDYRYFPEPDLVPIVIDNNWLDEIKKNVPELAHQRKERYTDAFLLPEYDAAILTSSKYLSDFFEAVISQGVDAKKASNWLMGDFSRIVKEKSIDLNSIPISAQQLAKIINQVENNTISRGAGVTVLEAVFESGDDPDDIIKQKGLAQISDTSELDNIIDQVLGNNPKSVEDYKAGKQQAIGYLVGQTMKASKGKANPKVVNQILRRKLEN